MSTFPEKDKKCNQRGQLHGGRYVIQLHDYMDGAGIQSRHKYAMEIISSKRCETISHIMGLFEDVTGTQTIKALKTKENTAFE